MIVEITLLLDSLLPEADFLAEFQGRSVQSDYPYCNAVHIADMKGLVQHQLHCLGSVTHMPHGGIGDNDGKVGAVPYRPHAQKAGLTDDLSIRIGNGIPATLSSFVGSVKPHRSPSWGGGSGRLPLISFPFTKFPSACYLNLPGIYSVPHLEPRPDPLTRGEAKLQLPPPHRSSRKYAENPIRPRLPI